MTDVPHRTLDGEDLHNSKAEEIEGDPVTIVIGGTQGIVPKVSGYFVMNKTNGDLWVSTGNESRHDWMKVSAKSNTDDVTHGGSPLSSIISTLEQARPAIRTHWGVLGEDGFLGGAISNSSLGVIWKVIVNELMVPEGGGDYEPSPRYYACEVFAIHDPYGGIDYSEGNQLVLPTENEYLENHGIDGFELIVARGGSEEDPSGVTLTIKANVPCHIRTTQVTL